MEGAFKNTEKQSVLQWLLNSKIRRRKKTKKTKAENYLTSARLKKL